MMNAPMRVSTLDTRDEMDCEIVFEMLSTSFVIRLMMSPLGWLSVYRIGR